jgi:hypothetical protein
VKERKEEKKDAGYYVPYLSNSPAEIHHIPRHGRVKKRKEKENAKLFRNRP